jgi:hypothetical protein
MKVGQMLRIPIVTAVLFGLCGVAKADDACVAELNALVRDWTSIAVPGTATTGTGPSAEHEHDAREVWYMRSQIRLALRLCNDGKTHEAMLRMDVVRAWLKLPEVQHPVDHRRSYEEKRP